MESKITLGITAGLILFVLLILSHFSIQKDKCEGKGGTYLQSYWGYVCVELERLDRPPQKK